MKSRVETKASGEIIISTDGEVILYENFFELEDSNQLFQELYSDIKWRQETIKMFGKCNPIPRLSAWYGDEGKSYIYSGIEHHPESWTPALLIIRNKIEEVSQFKFNSVLLNLYRDGKDRVSWHSDDEPELGKNPVIGSVSFGATRRFYLKHKQDKERKVAIDLSHGSFLLMRGETQHYWQHQITKTAKVVSPRINLTFRLVK